MGHIKLLYLCFFLSISTCVTKAVVKSTTAEEELDNNRQFFIYLPKTVYKNSEIDISEIPCAKDDEYLTIQWLLRYSPCADEYYSIDDMRLHNYWENPMYQPVPGEYDSVQFRRSRPVRCKCSECGQQLKEVSGSNVTVTCYYNKAKNKNEECKQLLALYQSSLPDKPSEDAEGGDTGETESGAKEDKEKPGDSESEPSKSKSRKRRDADSKQGSAAAAAEQGKQEEAAVTDVTTKIPNKGGVKTHNHIDKVWRDGPFLFILAISPYDDYNVTVSIKTAHGSYLSATFWPLLPFYGVMCVIYVIYGVAWLVVSALQWRDLLRIQFWIGAVIVLGMLEKALFYARYQHQNATNASDGDAAIIFAELVSCLKRTLARMLVIIVSLGFGIVKPRLGPMLHKVVGMGSLYFILAAVESCLRVFSHKEQQSNQEMLAKIPLAVIDVAICYWVFTSLVQTMRTLRLRRNIVKLSLYRHFTNTLIFAVLASVCFMIWSIKVYKMNQCLRDWQELWVDDAFWHLLFAIVLLVIMLLFRPTANNQRYAFKPLGLLDHDGDEEEEEEEHMLNDAYDVKQRSKSVNGSTPKAVKDPESKIEDDLKWVEEHIPSTVADAALPGLLDSDDEIMTTKTEMAKME